MHKLVPQDGGAVGVEGDEGEGAWSPGQNSTCSRSWGRGWGLGAGSLPGPAGTDPTTCLSPRCAPSLAAVLGARAAATAAGTFCMGEGGGRTVGSASCTSPGPFSAICPEIHVQLLPPQSWAGAPDSRAPVAASQLPAASSPGSGQLLPATESKLLAAWLAASPPPAVSSPGSVAGSSCPQSRPAVVC